MSGVRIKMQKYPFRLNRVALEWYNEGNEFDTYIPISLVSSKDLYVYPTMPFLRKVEYTKNDDLIYPSPIEYLNKKLDGSYDITGNFNDINKYKRDSWKFQSEWRYGMLIFPHHKDGRLNLQLEANAKDLPFYSYDVPILDEAFKNIEILTGSKMNDGDKELLRLLVQKYCPAVVIKKSELKIN